MPADGPVLRLLALRHFLVLADAEHERRPEPMKLIASTSTATGAVSAWTSTPAIAGPASWAPEREISSFELPSTSCSRSTREGRYDWYATSKKTVSTPIAKPTTYSWPIVRASNA